MKKLLGIFFISFKKKSGQECFLFANGYKIVWNNGTDRKEREHLQE
jgi:hypothetical protein